MQVLPIKLPDDLYQDLNTISQATNLSMAEFIRQSIDKPLKTQLKATQSKQQKYQNKIKANLKKVEKLAGGFNLGSGLNPSQMNQNYDKMYEEMLP